MKKVIIFFVIIIVLFGALAIVNHFSTSQKVEGNPFGKSSLNPATIEQLDDPNYQNIILPEELEASLDSEENMTIYFYQPTCPACVAVSPVIVPMADEMGIDMQLYNLVEFESGWSEYDISSTPTIVHFENGEEVGRVGLLEDEQYEMWFEQIAQAQ
ncbi:thioredoxin family protein [Halalkalibacter hemicellulosilyticus]|uniref:Thioredoxin n=1 Tax=Halalkalibacter hemicellulosilyticusJCM 9152 TaxID=1236971 RepID=W4QCN7_9BACI|nr:thioredoxin family protein [Halalkalibacter hemicellulosilyticus]GAE29821.1 thioredoxin [Halalkalibacter hemicellulosilyticusJCM 9152]